MDFSDKCKRDGSTGLFREFAFLAAACAATVAPIAAGAAEYEQGTTQEIVLMTGSADGTTNTLAEAIAAYNAAKGTDYSIDSFNGGDLAAYALVKEGDGTLVMDTEIANFTGPVVIKDGVVKCMCQYALGADTFDSHVYVRDGATLWCNRVSGKLNEKRTVHVVGEGHNGQGALASKKSRPSFSQNNVNGAYLHLDGDAKIANPLWAYVTSNLFLHAHTLTVFNAGTTGNTGDPCWLVTSVQDAGKIVLDNTLLYISASNGGTTLKDATPGNEITVGNESGFRFWGGNLSASAGRDTWFLNFTGKTAWLWGDDPSLGVRFTGGKNRLSNPIALDNTTLKLTSQGNVPGNWIKLTGPISGSGVVDLLYQDSQPAARLSLVNPANSFTGDVRVDKGLIYVYAPGSLPSGVSVTIDETGPLDHGFRAENRALPYHGLEFVAPGEHNLGSLTFKSTEYQGQFYPGRIQGGSGTFSEITKSTANTMEYFSGIGSPLLNVEGGTVKLPRGPAPGLWEGTNKTQNAGGQGSNGNWTFVSRATSTNLVARGPNLLNDTAMAHFGAVSDNQLINVYDGYIWNRETTNVTWTFATSIAQYACVYVDGTEVVHYSYIKDSSHESPAHQFDQVTLTPGPHTFQVRACLSSIRYGGGWPTNFGFVYDKLGRYVDKGGPSDGNFAAISNNFEFVIDPGDGSLLTRSIDEADLPHFDEMRFADGTTLDVNGNAYVARTVSGYPHVTSTAEDPSAAPSLTISNQLVADAADLVAGKKLSLDIPLVFGASSSVNVTNLVGVSRRKYTLAEVTGEGNAVSLGDRLRLPCTVDNGKWVVMPSDDGKRLEFCPASGLMVSLR